MCNRITANKIEHPEDQNFRDKYAEILMSITLQIYPRNYLAVDSRNGRSNINIQMYNESLKNKS